MSARWSNGGSSTAVARGTRWLPFALFTVALGVALVLVLHSLARAPSDARGDQGHYLNYMQTVHDRGHAAFPELFDQWNSDESSWILPPPTPPRPR